MHSIASTEIFLFERFRLDRRGGGLFHVGKRGALASVAIGSRALDVLSVLVERHGDLVSKDEIMAAAWPGIVVAESNLPIQIRAIRRILDFGRAQGSCIQTVAGRGYRFVAPVTTADTNAPLDPDPDTPSFGWPLPAERRPVTVLSAEIAGFSASASETDPEVILEPLAPLCRHCVDVIGQYDGFVANLSGEAVIAYFGYPAAHEDDAERAVRAGLALVDAVTHFEAPNRLQVHIGIATGLVVIGDVIGEGEGRLPSVVGAAPSLATRLQARAEPNTILISEGTRRHAGGFFALEAAGSQPLGISRRVWRVLGERQGLGRFEARRSGDTLLVGREEEIGLLVRRWAETRAGEGHAVLLSGEPGVGKSRLAEALEERLRDEPRHQLRYFCSPYHQNSAFYPIISQIERAAGFERAETPELKLRKLQRLLAPGSPPAEDIALLADLLSIPGSPCYPPLDFTPQRKKEQTFEAWLRQLAAAARRQPVLIVFEDLQWIDPTSRELLDLMIERLERWPILLIATFRPEFQSPWIGHPQVTALSLNRLNRRSAAALVQGLVGSDSLLRGDVADVIVERCDGVPLFLEELTKAVLEEAPISTPNTALEVPSTLHASLISRLDRLGTPAKEVAQIGAVLGRGFSHELIHHVARRPDLDPALGQLTDAGLLFCRGLPPQSSYLFKHSLVQDAAYDMLLHRQRRRLHGRIATALSQEFADLIERQPELLAHHLTGAGDTERAAAQWLKAAQYAAAHSAYREALANAEQGLSLLPSLPDSPERDSLEIELQVALGMSSIRIKGMLSPAVREAYERAGELAEKNGDERSLFQALYGVWQHNVGSGRIVAAHPLAERLLSVTGHDGAEPGLRLQAHHAVWTTFFIGGEPAGCLEHCKIGQRRYDPEKYQSHRDLYGGHDAGVCAWIFGGEAEWLLGCADTALTSLTRATTLAERICHPASLMGVLCYAAVLHIHRGEPELVLARLAAAETLAREQRMSPALAAQVLRGAALFLRGEVGDAIVCLRAGLPPGRTGGVRPLGFCILAEALANKGQFDEALAAISEAQQTVAATGEGAWNPELHRSHGLVLLSQNKLTESEAAFHRAIQLARQQQARSWELRAATSLARLWGEQGHRAEAQELLAPVYGCFTEGFDTRDLQGAKALLDALG